MEKFGLMLAMFLFDRYCLECARETLFPEIEPLPGSPPSIIFYSDGLVRLLKPVVKKKMRDKS